MERSTSLETPTISSAKPIAARHRMRCRRLHWRRGQCNVVTSRGTQRPQQKRHGQQARVDYSDTPLGRNRLTIPSVPQRPGKPFCQCSVPGPGTAGPSRAAIPASPEATPDALRTGHARRDSRQVGPHMLPRPAAVTDPSRIIKTRDIGRGTALAGPGVAEIAHAGAMPSAVSFEIVSVGVSGEPSIVKASIPVRFARRRPAALTVTHAAIDLSQARTGLARLRLAEPHQATSREKPMVDSMPRSARPG